MIDRRRSFPFPKRRSCLGLLLVASAGCAGPRGRPIPEMAAEINATLPPSLVILDRGDRLSIQFPNTVEWNHETVVRPDGHASFLFLDEVKVAGLSIEALDRRLTTAYETYLRSPELTVTLLSRPEKTVVVMGEVLKPGPIPMVEAPMTLVEALGRAGGPVKGSHFLAGTYLIRWLPNEQRQAFWLIDARQRHWRTPERILLLPNDIVYVPNNGIDRVDIWVDKYIRQMLPIPIRVGGPF